MSFACAYLATVAAAKVPAAVFPCNTYSVAACAAAYWANFVVAIPAHTRGLCVVCSKCGLTLMWLLGNRIVLPLCFAVACGGALAQCGPAWSTMCLSPSAVASPLHGPCCAQPARGSATLCGDASWGVAGEGAPSRECITRLRSVAARSSRPPHSRSRGAWSHSHPCALPWYLSGRGVACCCSATSTCLGGCLRFVGRTVRDACLCLFHRCLTPCCRCCRAGLVCVWGSCLRPCLSRCWAAACWCGRGVLLSARALGRAVRSCLLATGHALGAVCRWAAAGVRYAGAAVLSCVLAVGTPACSALAAVGRAVWSLLAAIGRALAALVAAVGRAIASAAREALRGIRWAGRAVAAVLRAVGVTLRAAMRGAASAIRGLF